MEKKKNKKNYGKNNKKVKKVEPKKVTVVNPPVEEKKVAPVKAEPKKVEPKKVEPQKPITFAEAKPKIYMEICIVFSAAVLVLITLLTIYLQRDLAAEKVEKQDYSVSYLETKGVGHVITCDDIANAITGDQSFIFVTSLNNEEEFKLEKQIAKIVKDNNLSDEFYIYIAGSDNCGSPSSASSVTGARLLLTSDLNSIPVILYYRNGKLTYIAQREDQSMLNAGDFSKLLDIYGITK